MELYRSQTRINKEGKIIVFGLQDFVNDIVKGDCCFICGAKPNSKKFNDEHVIPDWILRKFKLHGKDITLSNGTTFKYGQYKIPCCVECNSDLSVFYETPISNLLCKSYGEIIDEIDLNPQLNSLLFKWLSLIFLKTHLKDKFLRCNRDTRIESGFLSDNYSWEDMHHIHCIARSHHTGAKIDDLVYGTSFILPALTFNEPNQFDYVDSHSGKVIMLQLGEFSIISILNDSRAGHSFFKEKLDKINAPLSTFQLREIVAHLSFLNLNLKERPEYYSAINYDGEYLIKAEVPDRFSLIKKEERVITPGDFLRHYIQDIIENIDNREEFLNNIENNKRSFLFNEKGEFINHRDLF